MVTPTDSLLLVFCTFYNPKLYLEFLNSTNHCLDNKNFFFFTLWTLFQIYEVLLGMLIKVLIYACWLLFFHCLVQAQFKKLNIASFFFLNHHAKHSVRCVSKLLTGLCDVNIQ